MNSRLDTLQAAILIEKLKIFPNELRARNRVALSYSTELEGIANVPVLGEGLASSWAQYTLIVDDRASVQAALKEQGVPNVVYYPKALTQQGGYSNFPTVSSGVEVSEALTSRVLSLPMHPYLQDDTILRICNAFRS